MIAEIEDPGCLKAGCAHLFLAVFARLDELTSLVADRYAGARNLERTDVFGSAGEQEPTR